MTVEKSLFEKINKCVRCGRPETSEKIDFDELGLCKACRSSEQKMHISWANREKNLRKIIKNFKEKTKNNYDCIVPISGGKDSAFQLYLLTQVYDLQPLAVTFSHNWFTETGRYNLRNLLEKTNVDHIEFTPNRGLVNKLARESLKRIGDACWHCHTGVEAFPLNIACKFKIPLLIYGESVAETSGKATYLDNPDFSIDYFLQMSAKVKPEEMLCGDISQKEIAPFQSPTREEIESVGLKRIFLGDFIFWDAERQTEFVRDYLDWREEEVEGTYKHYKSVECFMPGVHDYAKYLKRGFGRSTDFSVQDVRAGLMTVQEAFQIQKERDPIRPKILDYYLDVTGYNEKQFGKTLEGHRDELAAKYLPSTKEMTKHTDLQVNNTVRKMVDQITEKKVTDIRLEGLQEVRVFPNFGFMERQAKIMLKKYGKEKHKGHCEIENPHLLSATQLIKEIKQGRLSVVALVESYYKQYQRIEKDVHAWVAYKYENTLLQARLIDEGLTEKKYLGEMVGIPVGIKDIFNTADYPTEMGSKTWANFEPGNDARCVNSLRLAGAIVSGKTVTAEYAIDTPGQTKNPYDLKRSPGTSSSGSAVAVSTRMAPIALGSQTAGSTIRPSSYVGIYGMKPSYGTIPRTGVLKTADSLDHITFMGLEVNDLKLVFDAIRVKGKNYPFVYRYLENEAYQSLTDRPLKIGIAITHTWNETAEYTKDGVRKFAQNCANLGNVVEEITMPSEFEEAHQIHQRIYDKSISYYFHEEYQTQKSVISESTLAMIERGLQTSTIEYREALKKQAILAAELGVLLGEYDIILSNSSAEVAQVGLDFVEKIDPCLIWSLCYVPSVNLPVLSGPHDLPLGLQVISARYRDYFLLNFCENLVKEGLAPSIAPIPKLAKDIYN
jgi:N-acetyl sugar amidotransferase